MAAMQDRASGAAYGRYRQDGGPGRNRGRPGAVAAVDASDEPSNLRPDKDD